MTRLALLMLLAATAARATEPQTAHMYSEGNIPEAADAFGKICVAHPLDIEAQRSAAKTRPMYFARMDAATQIESYQQGLLQLSLAAGPEGNLCAVLTPFVNLPTMAAATRDLRARLHLVGPGRTRGESTAWTRDVGGTHETIALSFTHQGANQGAVLTLSAKKAG